MSSPKLQDITALSWVSSLTDLSINDTAVSDLTPISNLRGLTHLSFYSTRVADLQPIAELTALRSLNFSLTSVTSIAPLAKLAALQALRMSRSHVADLSPLASLTSIRRLEYWGPATDLSPIGALTQMEDLLIPHTHGDSYRFVRKLKKLEYFRAEGSNFGRLSDLLGLRKLYHVVLGEGFAQKQIKRFKRKRPRVDLTLI